MSSRNTSSMDTVINYVARPQSIQISNDMQSDGCIYCVDDDCDGVSCSPPTISSHNNTTTTAINKNNADSVSHPVDYSQFTQTLDEPENALRIQDVEHHEMCIEPNGPYCSCSLMSKLELANDDTLSSDDDSNYPTPTWVSLARSYNSALGEPVAIKVVFHNANYLDAPNLEDSRKMFIDIEAFVNQNGALWRWASSPGSMTITMSKGIIPDGFPFSDDLPTPFTTTSSTAFDVWIGFEDNTDNPNAINTVDFRKMAIDDINKFLGENRALCHWASSPGFTTIVLSKGSPRNLNDAPDTDIPVPMDENETLWAQIAWLWNHGIETGNTYRENDKEMQMKVEALEKENETLRDENEALWKEGTELYKLSSNLIGESDLKIEALEKENKTLRDENATLWNEGTDLNKKHSNLRDESHLKIEGLENEKRMIMHATQSEREILQSEIAKLQKQIEHQKQNHAGCAANNGDNWAHVINLGMALEAQQAQNTRLKEELDAEKASKHEVEKKFAVYQDEVEQREVAEQEETAEMQSIIDDFEIKTLRHQAALEARDSTIQSLGEEATKLTKKLEQRRKERAEEDAAIRRVFLDQDRRDQKLEQQNEELEGAVQNLEEERRTEGAEGSVTVSKGFQDLKRRFQELEQQHETLRGHVRSLKEPLEQSMGLMDKLEAVSKSSYRSDGEGHADEEDNVEDLSEEPEEIRLEDDSEQQHVRFSEETDDGGHGDDEGSYFEPSEPEYVIVDGRNELRAWNGRARRGSECPTMVHWDEESLS